MNRVKRIVSSLIAASALLGAGATLVPALAAQEDVDLLKSYIGEWNGTGTTTNDGETETVRCKLSITDGENTRINYNGRCAIAGATLSIKGTMAYVEENKRFEAVMSSNTSFQGIAVGKRRGSGLSFQLKNRDPKSGEDFAVDAGLALKSGNIQIDFAVTQIATGRKITAVVPFEK